MNKRSEQILAKADISRYTKEARYNYPDKDDAQLTMTSMFGEQVKNIDNSREEMFYRRQQEKFADDAWQDEDFNGQNAPYHSEAEKSLKLGTPHVANANHRRRFDVYAGRAAERERYNAYGDRDGPYGLSNADRQEDILSSIRYSEATPTLNLMKPDLSNIKRHAARTVDNEMIFAVDDVNLRFGGQTATGAAFTFKQPESNKAAVDKNLESNWTVEKFAPASSNVVTKEHIEMGTIGTRKYQDQVVVTEPVISPVVSLGSLTSAKRSVARLEQISTAMFTNQEVEVKIDRKMNQFLFYDKLGTLVHREPMTANDLREVNKLTAAPSHHDQKAVSAVTDMIMSEAFKFDEKMTRENKAGAQTNKPDYKAAANMRTKSEGSHTQKALTEAYGVRYNTKPQRQDTALSADIAREVFVGYLAYSKSFHESNKLRPVGNNKPISLEKFGILTAGVSKESMMDYFKDTNELVKKVTDPKVSKLPSVNTSKFNNKQATNALNKQATPSNAVLTLPKRVESMGQLSVVNKAKGGLTRGQNCRLTQSVDQSVFG